MSKRLSATPQSVISLPAAIDLVRFEKNLLQIGFFSAHDPRTKNSLGTARRIEQWVNREGKKIRVSAEFRSTLGLPSTADRDKYMAFMKIAMERKLIEGKLTNPIRFSGYSMLKALGLSDSGANYEDLNQWGMRMADTTITSEQIIYSSSRKKFMNKTVHVFRSFTRVGESDSDGANQTVQFAVELEDWLLENVNQSYVVPEDFTQYRRLVRPTAKGIFVYLYVWFYASRGKEVEKDYTELCALLNVRCYQHLSKIRETMGLSLDDLVRIGYLKTWCVKPMLSKKGFKLMMTPGSEILEILASTQRRQLTSSASTKDLTPAQQDVLSLLNQRGIEEPRATVMSRIHDFDALTRQLEYLDHEIEKDAGKRIKNPAGFIIAWLEGQNAVPDTFQSVLKREEQRHVRDQQRRRDECVRADEQAEADLRQSFQHWRLQQANEVIAKAYTPAEMNKRLNSVREEISKTTEIARFLNELPAEKRREELLKVLRKEIAGELSLLSFEEWANQRKQGSLSL